MAKEKITMRMRGPSFKKHVMRELKIKNPRSYIPDPKKELQKGIKSGCGCLVVFVLGTLFSATAIGIKLLIA
jgi:hypothetical protein